MQLLVLISYVVANLCLYKSIIEPPYEKTEKTNKAQISFAVTAKLISAFVFATPLLSKSKICSL